MHTELLTALLLSLPLTPMEAPVANSEGSPLLGVITAPGTGQVEVLHVLQGSPAAAAGLRRGDRLVRLAERTVSTPAEVEKILARLAPGRQVALEILRDGQPEELTAELIDRRTFDGAFAVDRKRPARGFEAPEWFAFAWANVLEDEAPPTLESTKGKVVVIHAFQSW